MDVILSFLIAAKGTGDWTVTIHDSTNTVVRSKTIANADIVAGQFEFIFDEIWRPLLNAEYHIHVTSTVADDEIPSQK